MKKYVVILREKIIKIINLLRIHKRILFISHNLHHEGATRSLFYLAKEFKNKGFNVKVLSPVDGPLKNKFIEHKIDYIVEPTFFSNPENSIPLLKQFDIIYLNTIVNFSFIHVIKKIGLSLIWCIRESEKDHCFKLGITKNHFKLVDTVVFVADATRKIYSDMEFDRNFITIPNGLDIQEIESYMTKNNKNDLRKKYGFSSKDKLITIIGTVCERKGQLDFVNSAIKLLKSCDDELHFLLVGTRKDDYNEKIEKKISFSNYESKIKLIPVTENVYDYYRMSDIFVCSSYIESFPRTILEAMAFKLPIIATNVFGIPEQIENGKEGILIRPGDSNLLAEKVQFLLSNPSISKKYVQAANTKLKQKFSIEKMIYSYEQLFDRIIKLKGN